MNSSGVRPRAPGTGRAAQQPEVPEVRAHVPDGFLDAPPSTGTAVVAAGVALALRGSRRELDERTAPMAGLTAAFVFAAQMMNFPVAFGTSGHLMGGALAAVLVGPWTAVLCLTVVLGVQALVFADGGLTALGASMTLIGLVAIAVGYGVFCGLRAVLPATRTGLLASAGVGAFLSVPAAAAIFVLLFGLGGVADVPLGRSGSRWSACTCSSASARRSSPSPSSVRCTASDRTWSAAPGVCSGQGPRLDPAGATRWTCDDPHPRLRADRGGRRTAHRRRGQLVRQLRTRRAGGDRRGTGLRLHRPGQCSRRLAAVRLRPGRGRGRPALGGLAGVVDVLLVLALAGGLTLLVRRRPTGDDVNSPAGARRD